MQAEQYNNAQLVCNIAESFITSRKNYNQLKQEIQEIFGGQNLSVSESNITKQIFSYIHQKRQQSVVYQENNKKQLDRDQNQVNNGIQIEVAKSNFQLSTKINTINSDYFHEAIKLQEFQSEESDLELLSHKFNWTYLNQLLNE
ncbi:Hypothetical_protein [Hexamita inflata]|uniref:Hypothetical_protein n=1 Tax=Hexamita inflata TaxID=28002 RepID=A0AA86NFW2_9EUKA|nr:Hypothetical protein HINF_LOCUS6049 [Hexamita inflata]